MPNKFGLFNLFSTKIDQTIDFILAIIYLPGLRGNPERSYPIAATGPNFPGVFTPYTASLVHQWIENGRDVELEGLRHDLSVLRLTGNIRALRLNDTQIELQVSRAVGRDRGPSTDFVNIADVGFGVSQTLPVVVALHAAQPGQLVYIEQPELHLHPRAQCAMAEVLARAAMRGVRVVAETHSDLLILAIRTLVAEGKLPPDLVRLHWFQRDAKGRTKITSADMDERGASADWPEDFADVQLEAQSRYLDAAEARLGTR